MSKMIFLSLEKRKALAREFSVTRQSVWAALTFKTKAGKGKLLRAAALQRGGVIVNLDGKPDNEPCFTTYFDEVPHRMVQVFSERVRLICNLEGTGDVVIEVDGKVVSSFGELLMSQLPMAQAQAQSLANKLS